jgi:hypothetical protein
MDGSFSTSLDRENPWPGLDPFTEDCAAYFHGRDGDIAELDRRIKRASLTVLFGKSGLGKTSLIRAGLFPRLRRGDYLPVYVRLDPKSDRSFVQQIKEALRRAIAENVERLDVEPPRDDEAYSLWEYFHAARINFWTEKNRLLTPVIVLDQFEEIFSLGTAEQRAPLIKALAELVENRCPPELEKALAENVERADKFDFTKQGCRLLLSFREDFLAYFVEFRQTMPSLGANHMRLVALGYAQAKEAIEAAGGHLLDDGVSDRIIAAVASSALEESLDASMSFDRASDVEPYLLSVFCRELNEKRKYWHREKITADLLESQSEILDEFYTKAIADLDPAVRLFVEDRLLTVFGYRQSIDEEDAQQIPNVTKDAIDTLVDRRLLRREERLNRAQIELTHDKLASVIKKHRDRRAELNQRDEYRRLINRRRNRAAAWLLAATVCVFVFVVGRFLSYVAEEAAEDQKTQRAELTQQILRAGEISEQFRYLPGGLQLVDAVRASIDASIQRFETEHAQRETKSDGGLLSVPAQLFRDLIHGNVKSFASRVFGPSADEEDQFVSLLNGVKSVFGAAALGIRGNYAEDEAVLQNEAAGALYAAGTGPAAAAAWIDWYIQHGTALGSHGEDNSAAFARAAEIASDVLLDRPWGPDATPASIDAKAADEIIRQASLLVAGSGQSFAQKERLMEKWDQAMIAWAGSLARSDKSEARRRYDIVERLAKARIAAIEGHLPQFATDAKADGREKPAYVYWKSELARLPWRVAALEPNAAATIADYKIAIQRAQEPVLANSDPVRAAINVAYTQLLLAQAYVKSGRFADARGALNQSYNVFNDLAELDPDDSYWILIAGMEDEAFGDIAQGLGAPIRDKTAAQWYARALDDQKKLNSLDEDRNQGARKAIAQLEAKLKQANSAASAKAAN